MEKKDKLNLLSSKNIHLFSWKYKFYNIADNHIKHCKIFSPYTQFKKKGLKDQDTKKQKNIVLS